jgi:hypothetical protein
MYIQNMCLLYAPVHQVSFCPWDSAVVLVIGRGILRLFRYFYILYKTLSQILSFNATILLYFCLFISSNLHEFLPDPYDI